MNRRIVWVCASLALVMLVAAADAQQQGRGQRGQRGQGQEGAQAHDYTGKDTKGIEDIVNDAIAQKSWRADAYERIDQYRKADLAITVKDASGRVLPNAEITIEQTDHEFPFGMVASARRIVGVGETSDLYRKILPYFANKLCLENSLKQRHGPSNEERTREVFRWAKEHGFEIRGHNLIWPHARFLPMDVETFVYGKTHTSYNEHIASEPLDLSEAQKEELRNMVAQKIADWAAKWDVPDWDVINEPRVNHHLMDILGKEVIVDWFKIAREHAVRPDAGLILNENRVISGGPEEYEDNINNYMGWIQLLVDHDAPITGIGFQARMNHDVSAEEIWRRLNLFNKFGLPLSITEMQVQRRNDPSLKEYKKAELIERAMTLYFSHPMVDQIFQWDLMARGEKRNMDEEELSQTQMRAGRALVWSDGSLKLNGKIYLWLINNHWRTNETVKTDENGTVQLRGFKGTYKIRAKHNGQSIDLGTIQLPEGGCRTELTADIN